MSGLSDSSGLTRRGFLKAAALTSVAVSVGLPSISIVARAATSLPRLSIAEGPEYWFHSSDVIRRRFDAYRQVGIDTLRTVVHWRQEKPDGSWSPVNERWLDLALAHGFKFKVEFAALSGPAAWFLETHPEARLVDRVGEYSRNDLSFFWPETRRIVAEKTERLARYWFNKNYGKATDFVILNLGPAGEMIYPADWTLGPGHHEVPGNFWFYGPGADESFRLAMAGKYSSIKSANRAWGTQFSDWKQVTIPKLGTQPGRFWQDVLIWYRDEKRSFASWQLKNTREVLGKVAQGANPQLIALVPGQHLKPTELDQAFKTGVGNYRTTIMIDTDFIVELAGSQHCTLEYTGMPNPQEIAYINSLRKRFSPPPPLWGENIDTPQAADQMHEMFRETIDAQLEGFELVHADYLFGKDGQTPTTLWSVYRSESEALRKSRQ